MPTWGELIEELKVLSLKDKKNHTDQLRRKYLNELHNYTKRDIIIYATNWTQAGRRFDSDMLSINYEDVQGFMEVLHNLNGKELDLIIHSPGGSAEAAESIVKYIRTKYEKVRIFVPQGAMSAATMLACSGNTICMGKHSSLGPIDPQMILPTQNGVMAVPADAIIEQFGYAENYIKDHPDSLQTWFPLLNQYYPGLLIQCLNAKELAEELVTNWISKYMFDGDETLKEIAGNIAESLSAHEDFKSHGRPIDREQAASFGLVIENLEDDQQLQDLVLSVFHATTLTFSTGNATKLIENHLGKAFVTLANPIGFMPPPPPPPEPKPPEEPSK